MTARIVTLTGTSPASASTAVGNTVNVTGNYEFLRVDAFLVGATGGALNVYLQRRIAPGFWADWVAFAQLASGAAAIRYSLMATPTNSTTIVTANAGTDATPAVGLAAGTFLGGHPGTHVRAVYVAGVGTSAGAAVTIYFSLLETL